MDEARGLVMVYITSKAGIELIKRWEGLRLESYKDQAGVWTIGYGHTGSARFTRPITQEEADHFLAVDVLQAEKAVNQLTTTPLEQREFDAMVSFTFNLGRGNLETSALLKRINAGDKIGGAVTLPLWCNAMVNGKLTPLLGLARRRADELKMFLG